MHDLLLQRQLHDDVRMSAPIWPQATPISWETGDTAADRRVEAEADEGAEDGADSRGVYLPSNPAFREALRILEIAEAWAAARNSMRVKP